MAHFRAQFDFYGASNLSFCCSKLKNLTDGFCENPRDKFPVGMLVAGRVTEVDVSLKQVKMTLKSSEVVEQSLQLQHLKKVSKRNTKKPYMCVYVTAFVLEITILSLGHTFA